MAEKKKRKRGHHEIPEEGEGWLVSYADLMTVLTCFFILLVSMANFDPPKFGLTLEQIAKHFDPKRVDGMKSEIKELEAAIKKNDQLTEKASIKREGGDFLITFSGSTLFDSGRSDLKNEIVASVDAMINLIKESNPNYLILVEGHTDSAPFKSVQKYSSNWELSGARASRLVERFEKYGFKRTQLMAIGYGDTRPLVPDHSKEGEPIVANMQKNRRVVIKVIQPPSQPQVKLGLGIYFDEDGNAKPVLTGGE